ncbi:MAG: oligosaccharide flippase family protein [Euryarchaeota archaeon]|nr:oligosaccharide flippase family protein [Euryarchaeota archaeon]
MGLVRNVARNSLALGTVQVASQISTFILSIFLASYLPEQYGTYTYAFSLSSLIFIITDFGLGFQMVVEVAPDHSKASQHLTNTIFLRGILGALSLGIMAIVVLIDKPPHLVTFAILIIALATAFNWITMTFNSMLTAFESMHYVMYTNLVERAFTVSAAIILLILGFGLEIVVLVVLAGSILLVILSYIVTTKRVVVPSRKIDIRGSLSQLKRATPYATSGVMQTSLYSLNAVLVWQIILRAGGTVHDASEATGYYNLAFNMVVVLVSVPTVLMNALLPVISRLYHTSTDLARLTQQKAMKYMFALGLPIAVGGIFLAEDIILLFYPDIFLPSASVFRILILSVAVSFFGVGIGSVLASASLIRLNTVASGVGALANVILCIVLIPTFKEIGAAAAFSFALFSISAVAFYFMSTRVFKVDLTDILLKPMVAATGMGLVLFIFPGMSLFLSLGIGAAVYFALLFVTRAIDKEDRDILMRMLNKDG